MMNGISKNKTIFQSKSKRVLKLGTEHLIWRWGGGGGGGGGGLLFFVLFRIFFGQYESQNIYFSRI